MHRRSPVPGLLIALCILTALTACGHGGAATAVAGRVYDDIHHDVDAHSIHAMTPGADVQVTFGDFVQSSIRTTDGTELRAPSGGAFLPIRVTVADISSTGNMNATGQGSTAGEETTVAVRADGHDTPIASSHRAAGPESVALPTTSDVQLVVTFDGLSQTVDVPSGKRTPGPADAVYQRQRSHSPDCRIRNQQAGELRLGPWSCLLNWHAEPWYGRWASPGDEFVAFSLDAGVGASSSAAGGRVQYAVASASATISIDGSSPVRLPAAAKSPPGLASWHTEYVAIEAPRGKHVATLTFHIRWKAPPGAGSPARPVTTTTRRFDLG